MCILSLIYMFLMCIDHNLSVSECVDGDVRLVDGPTQFEGTVEVC